MTDRTRRLGLRARATVASSALVLVVAVSVSVTSYQLVRSELVSSRTESAASRAQVNARALRNVLLRDEPGDSTFLAALGGDSGSVVLARVGGEWFSSTVGASPDDIPTALRELVSEGSAGRQRARVDGEAVAAIGIPLPAVDGRYFELAPLADIDDSLATLARSLAVAALVATVAGGAVGWYTSRRVLRPLRHLSVASEGIAAGRYETRLPVPDDPDIGALVRSFNVMAGSVQDRIAREVRFTADAAHELRSPVASMLASVWVARRRQDDPASAIEALDSLETRLEEFRDLVVDLLELARSEGSGAEAMLEPCDVRQLVASVVAQQGTSAQVRIDEAVPQAVVLDRRRTGQAILNLLDNAAKYGGGATHLTVSANASRLEFVIDDAGPGVPVHERSYVFDRFARGEQAARGERPGSGLGLALVAEHARLQDGRVRLEDSPSGGARFVFELPLVRP